MPLLAAVAVAAEDAGVREERFRAALIRTLTVDGIIMLVVIIFLLLLMSYVVPWCQ